MARKVEWIHQLGSAIEELRRFPCPSIDRAGIEKLFRVSPRQALRIMDRLGAYTAGKSLLLDRQELISRLEALQLDESVQFEQRRRSRVADDLARIRRELAARQVSIPAMADVRQRHLDGLSPTIRFAPHRLEIAFAGAPDLLRQLFELSQAMANDYEAFNDLLGGG